MKQGNPWKRKLVEGSREQSGKEVIINLLGFFWGGGTVNEMVYNKMRDGPLGCECTFKKPTSSGTLKDEFYVI